MFLSGHHPHYHQQQQPSPQQYTSHSASFSTNPFVLPSYYNPASLHRGVPPPVPGQALPAGAAASATGHGATLDEYTLVSMLASGSPSEKLQAAKQVREMARSNEDVRLRLGNAGAIPPLLRILSLHDPALLEASCYALLNLSITEENKSEMANLGAAQAITLVLDMGTPRVKEAAAAVAFSLSSASDETKVEIGSAGAIPFLIQIFIDGSDRAKEDALLALFNLSLVGENKASLIASAVPQPISRMLRTSPGHRLAEKAVGTLRNLATRQDGRDAIVEGGGLGALAKVLTWGSPRAQDDAAASLLAVARADERHREMTGQEAVHVPLMNLAKNGSERGRARVSNSNRRKRWLLSAYRERNRTQRRGGTVCPSIERRIEHE